MKAFRLPLLLFALPALVVAFAANHAPALRLDRTVLDHGEIWRLWTGHWVHFSTSHLGWNLLVLLLAGAGLERTCPGWLLRHTLVAAPLVSLIVLAAEPAMLSYGGLSALATSVVTLLALAQLRAARGDRPLWTAVLVLVAGKVAWEAGHPGALFSRFDSPEVRSSAFAHAAGAGVALLLAPLWLRRRPPEMKPPGPVAGSRRQGSGSYP